MILFENMFLLLSYKTPFTRIWSIFTGIESLHDPLYAEWVSWWPLGLWKPLIKIHQKNPRASIWKTKQKTFLIYQQWLPQPPSPTPQDHHSNSLSFLDHQHSSSITPIQSFTLWYVFPIVLRQTDILKMSPPPLGLVGFPVLLHDVSGG